MTKDEALDLALEALESCSGVPHWPAIRATITAIKQARALDKMAENARELGLDYEPVDGTQVSKVWWDGEKLMAKPIPLEDFYQPAPVQQEREILRAAQNEAVMPLIGPMLDAWEGGSDFLNEYPELDKQLRRIHRAMENATPPAQPAPVQEPVAWRLNGESSLGHGKVFGEWKSGKPPKDVADLTSADKNWSLEFAYTTPPAQPAPVQKPKQCGLCGEAQPFKGTCGGGRNNPKALCHTPPAAQPAPVAFEVGLVEWVGNKLMATPKVTTTPPASWMEMVTANLVREGVNKHKARELAEHFYSLAQRQWVGLTDEEIESLQRLAIDPVDANGWGFLNRERFAEAIEAKLKEKNNG